MRLEDLIARAPTLTHTTSAEAWPGIRSRGLLPVDRLLALFDVPPGTRDRLLSQRRPTARRLTHPEHGVAWVRDQRPLNELHLARMLDGDPMTVEDYVRRINGLSFFWADPARLERLRRVRRYADHPHVVLTVDTRSLVASHHERVVLTRINSGAALFPSGRRGRGTFCAIEDFPARSTPVELAVAGGVADLARHLLRVQRWCGDQVQDVEH